MSKRLIGLLTLGLILLTGSALATSLSRPQCPDSLKDSIYLAVSSELPDFYSTEGYCFINPGLDSWYIEYGPVTITSINNNQYVFFPIFSGNGDTLNYSTFQNKQDLEKLVNFIEDQQVYKQYINQFDVSSRQIGVGRPFSYSVYISGAGFTQQTPEGSVLSIQFDISEDNNGILIPTITMAEKRLVNGEEYIQPKDSVSGNIPIEQLNLRSGSLHVEIQQPTVPKKDNSSLLIMGVTVLIIVLALIAFLFLRKKK